MRTLPQYLRVVVFAALAGAGSVFLATTGWPQPDHVGEIAGLVLAAIAIAAFAASPLAVENRGGMTASFVVDLGALMLFGGNAALGVASIGAAARLLAYPERAIPLRRTVVNVASLFVGIEVAWLAYSAINGAMDAGAWPWRGVPIAAAAAVYALVKIAAAEAIAPLLDKTPFNRSWVAAIPQTAPTYFIGAAISAGLVEIVSRGAWELLPVAAIPLYCAHRVSGATRGSADGDSRHRQVIDSLDQGMAVLDAAGRVTLWNDALERLVDCRRERVLGQTVTSALPALAQTPLARAIADALSNRRACVLAPLPLPSPTRARVLEVKILPMTGGATLLWQDITERTQAEQALKRTEERFTLAAEGALDGLWEWDFRTQAFYASGRWRAMLGLPAAAGVGKPDEWLSRVHAEDVAALKEALDAHLAGDADHLEHEHRIRHEDGTYRRFLCRGVAARGANQKPVRIAGSLTEAAAQGSAKEPARSVEFRDPLTGLCNRADFVERLGRRLADVKRQKTGDSFAALYLDLDRFKIVNDSLGHMVGDELLVAVARRLESCLRQGDSLARLGGDEFAILLNAIGDPQQANAIAFRIQKALSDPFPVAGREVFTSASIGIAFGLSHYDNPEEIMRDADTAMYHAKSRGKARHELFDADMHARTRDRLGLENDLRQAINNNAFEVHYQPIVLLASRMCVGFESLIRWTRNGEPVSPATFVPMAEELGLIESLGTWVLQQACGTFAEWQRQYPDAGLDYITVNVSSRQLMQQNFLHLVEQAVHAAKLRPRDLRLEITETALMDSPTSAAKLLSELRDFGVKIYLDDFGTGYSSLSHLHKLPVDALKIDRSFVRSLDLGSDRPAIVESILALARTLNTSVVAEGIESDGQARELVRLGCTHAQGYLFARPLTSHAAEQVIAAHQPLGPKSLQTESIAAPRAFDRTDRIAV